MNLVAICIAFIVSIVSVGTPLIFQVISKFDEKYHSEKIVDLFKKESSFKLLKYLLIAAPISVLFYIIASKLLVHFHEEIYSQILSWMSYLLLALTVVLLIQFIYFSFIVLKYSIPSSFIKARINYLNKSTKRIEKEENLEVVTNFFLYSIQKELIDVCSLMPDYLYYVFSNYREKMKNDIYAKHHILNMLSISQRRKILRLFKDFKISGTKKKWKKPIERFPNNFYKTTNLIAKEIVIQNSIRLKSLDYYASGFTWLVGATEDAKISEETYNVLWANLSFLIDNGKDEMVLKYWEQAVHHFEYNLQSIDPIYKSFPDNLEHLNQKAIEERNNERETFLDFHYYIGGLLLYKNRIECIHKIWNHTNSIPFQYPLLPIAIGEIFRKYFELCQNYGQKNWDKAMRFRFPGLDSITFDWGINRWVRDYLILLFLRQYNLQRVFPSLEPLCLPKLPEDLSEKKQWKTDLGRFKEELEKYLKNADILKVLIFDFKSLKPDPVELLEQIEQNLTEQIQIAKENMTILADKRTQFYSRCAEIIKKTFNEYFGSKNIFIRNEAIDSALVKKITKLKMIQGREPFVDSTISHLNFDSILASDFSTYLKLAISESFLLPVSQSFLFKENEIYSAIDKLKITNNPENFIIISFQQSIDYYKRAYKINGLNEDNYKGIKIFNFQVCNQRYVAGSYFIMKKEDLPHLIINKPEFTSEYCNIIIPEFEVFASVIDLKTEDVIRRKVEADCKQERLEDSVLTTIEMNAEIRWKKEAKVIAFRAASAYEDRGLPNKLEEVKPFDEI